MSATFRRYSRIFAVIGATCVLLAGGAVSAQAFHRGDVAHGASADVSWPQFGYGPTHAGWNYRAKQIDAHNVSTLVKHWSYGAGTQQGDDIVAAGSVFFTTNGKLVSVALGTGKLNWSVPWSGLTDPAYLNGTLFATDKTAPNRLVALNPTSGKTRWSVSGPSLSWPTVAGKAVYVTSFNRLLAFRPDIGHLLWATTIERCPKGIKGCELYMNSITPAVYGGMVFVSSHSQYLYAVGAAHGKLLWHSQSLNPGSGHPVDKSGPVTVEVSHGHVLLLTNLRVICVSHTTGHIRWTYTQGYVQSAGGANGMSAAYGLVFETGLGTGPHGANPAGEAIDLNTGKPKWQFFTYGYSAEFPSVANGLLYAEDSASDIFAYSVGNGHRVAVITGLGTYGPTYPAIVGSNVVESNFDFKLPS